MPDKPKSPALPFDLPENPIGGRAFGDDDEDSTSVSGAPVFDPPAQDPAALSLRGFGDDDDSTSVSGAPTFDPPEHDPAAISLDDDDEDRTVVDKRPGPRQG